MSVQVKICGITRPADARLAAELGASAIGIVFWPGSPRFVDPERARAIVEPLPAGVRAVGVFVDQPPAYVRDVAARLGLGAVQLHGGEDPAQYRDAGAQVLKSVAVGPGFDPAVALSLPPDVTVLLDAHDPARRGGTGRTIDWDAAAAIARQRPTVLSGGITPSNVRQAVDQVQPYMIDVSSGVESAPGEKDAGKLRALFREL